MKRRVEEKFPGCILQNEMRIICGKCKTVVNLNRTYYDDYFEKKHILNGRCSRLQERQIKKKQGKQNSSGEGQKSLTKTVVC